ncbi:helix-turn-helix domain-containing protein [Anaerobacillus isosaccharinicus]|uniref:Helix-turn-helix domain-containing protein n=1 Tax=Anaerobacillus isosaccharinicus TaxID=1532552 RepID=A0A1S2MCX1_9BACI|nr:helix-turn-helix transcriptional regulator [Anaerobacillus isosaccharinicus]MBA5588590.1 helix-turn-helix domain-containing protein [Anaerobacillus isosaccharinicus]QOY37996.1 helix-turn-helix domain-containing protein [Anaerobacillus isosaccharinicus]
MFGLGKPRSKFGRFLDENEIKQQELVRESNVNRTTISKLCQGDAFTPSARNANKLIKTLRRLTGKDIDYDDFWKM